MMKPAEHGWETGSHRSRWRGHGANLPPGRDRTALDAGVVRAVLGIAAPDMADRWRVDGVPQHFAFDGPTLEISVQDELGRFDLNAIDASVLTALLKAEQVPPDQAETLADRILDWPSPSDLHRPHGATSEGYAKRFGKIDPSPHWHLKGTSRLWLARD